MSLTNEDLLAISLLLDAKMQPMEKRIKGIEILLENDMLPRLQNIESCYTSTYRRYQGSIEDLEALKSDVDIMKKVITEHSQKLQKLA